MVKVNNPENKFNSKKFMKFCKKKKIIYPESVVEFLTKNNDGEFEQNIIEGFDDGYYIRYFYGTTDESYSNIADVYEMYIDRLPNKCVPIADPDFGNQICLSLADESYGNIYFWDHETMDTDYGEKCALKIDDMRLLAKSFQEFLEKIIKK